MQEYLEDKIRALICCISTRSKNQIKTKNVKAFYLKAGKANAMKNLPKLRMQIVWFEGTFAINQK